MASKLTITSFWRARATTYGAKQIVATALPKRPRSSRADREQPQRAARVRISLNAALLTKGSRRRACPPPPLAGQTHPTGPCCRCHHERHKPSVPVQPRSPPNGHKKSRRNRHCQILLRPVNKSVMATVAFFVSFGAGKHKAQTPSVEPFGSTGLQLRRQSIINVSPQHRTSQAAHVSSARPGTPHQPHHKSFPNCTKALPGQPANVPQARRTAERGDVNSRYLLMGGNSSLYGARCQISTKHAPSRSSKASK